MTEYRRMKTMAQIRLNPPRAMIAQGYQAPVERDACQNCIRCISKREGNLRTSPIHRTCEIGDFPVSPLGICKDHKRLATK